MKIRLGYVAISKTLENVTSSSMMTYTYYNKLEQDNVDKTGKANKKLNDIVLSNFRDLELILKYNIKNDITFYRLTSKLVPLSTHNNVPINIDEYKTYFKKIGDIIKENRMRIDTHPDQFCVLNSTKKEVVKNSIIILEEHKKIFDFMNYPGLIILHIGSSVFGKEASIRRFEKNFLILEKGIQSRIILENDDKVYTMLDTLQLCEKLNIPMVLDYHHHLCNNNGEKIQDYILRIINTWRDNNPKIHFSSPKNKKEFRSHHDYIDVDKFIEFIETIKFINIDIDIMLEAKMKDEALFRLVRLLKYKTNYKLINSTTFEI